MVVQGDVAGIVEVLLFPEMYVFFRRFCAR